MANTVNDVMNVIASPDYGIKNIASTNQEILAILSGTHNSKNNIHSIVDDIKTLLQQLVNEVPKQKPIEIDGNALKAKQKHVKSLLAETKGIRKSIDNLAKKIEKQGGGKMPAVAKLSDKASQKVADAMVKNLDKQNKGGGLSSMIDAFKKLKDISLKDIIFGNQKVKIIGKVFKNAEKDLKIKDKDLDAIIKLINAAPEMMQALKKVGRRVNRIIKENVIQKLGDLLVGKNSVLTVSRSLQKNKKTFEEANAASKTVKELVSTLNKAMFKLMITLMLSKPAQKGIDSADTIIDKILPLSKKLTKNKASIQNGQKTAKQITSLVGNLLITSIFLTIAAVTGIPALVGTLYLSEVVDRTITIAKKLTKNKNVFNKATKEAFKLTTLIGNLLITSVFLSVAAVTGIPAILGALLLRGMVSVIIPVAKKLSRSNKHIAKGIISALGLIAFTGLMGVTCILLTGVAKIGLNALIGSLVILGITVVNALTFGILSMAKSAIMKGAGVMALMSLALVMYGISLGILVKATKDLNFKQIGVLATITILFGGIMGVLGIPPICGFVALGAGVMALMGLALLPYAFTISIVAKAVKDINLEHMKTAALSLLILGGATALVGLLLPFIVLGSLSMFAMSLVLPKFIRTLTKIEKNLKNLKMKQIWTVVKAMGALALGISGLSIFLIPVGFGALTLAAINKPLGAFVRTVKIINDMGTVPTKLIKSVLSAMKMVVKFFSKNAIKPRVVKNAKRCKTLLRPFGDIVKHLNKLNKMGTVPLELVYITLEAISAIGKHFVENPVSKSDVKVAKNYMKMMRPFKNTVRILSKLKKMSNIPIDLVHQTLDAMGVIGKFYVDNPIEKEVIKQSKKYMKMMRPFGRTLKYFAKLKKLGGVPIDLVHQTLDAMTVIANYYTNNPIEKETIKQAKRYRKVMRPFGRTLKYFAKLKKLGEVPIDLVHQTLDAMTVIANYYTNNPIEKETIKQAKRYRKVMRPFGRTLKYFAKLKKLGGVPIDLVHQTLDAMKVITDHFINNPIEKETVKQAKRYRKVMRPFGRTLKHLNKLKEMGVIPEDVVKSTVKALVYITKFYETATISDDVEAKSFFTKIAVENFTELTGSIQDKFINVPEVDIKAVTSVTSACRSIMSFYASILFVPKEEKIKLINESIKEFADTSNHMKTNIGSYTKENFMSVELLIRSMKNIFKFYRKHGLNKKIRAEVKKDMRLLDRMSKTMSKISRIDPLSISSVGDALTTSLEGVHAVKIDQVKAVTNMFRAFKDINKSENIINKFAESVKEFTTVCNDLMEAMNQNTEAISGMDPNSENDGESSSLWGKIKDAVSPKPLFDDFGNPNDNAKVGGVRIVNVDELARTIAERINGAISVDVPDTQVQLLINGTGGNEWTITKY